MIGATVTITFFRFHGLHALWMLPQMQLALRGLRRGDPAPSFFKLMGSGGEDGFSVRPGFDTYAFLAVWPDQATADGYFETNDRYRALLRHASEQWTVYLQPTASHGAWSGVNPFRDTGPRLRDDEIMAVITRASIRKRYLMTFWRDVPRVSEVLRDAPGRIFSIGVGEWPWIEQATFSLWRNAGQMRDFAYHHPEHARVIRRTRELDWYSEELFANFRPIRTAGTWAGDDPLTGLLAGGPGHGGLDAHAATAASKAQPSKCPFQ